jgi:uroporphyrinogen decarboxylase
MTSKERVLNSLARKGYDRIPIKHVAEPEVNQQLMEYLGVSTALEVMDRVGDDFRYVEPAYIGPKLKVFEEDIEIDDPGILLEMGIRGETYKRVSFGAGTYNEATHLSFKDIPDTARLDELRRPSADWYDYSTVGAQCRKYSDYAIIGGWAGTLDLINGIARCRGVEQTLLDIATEDPAFTVKK